MDIHREELRSLFIDKLYASIDGRNGNYKIYLGLLRLIELDSEALSGLDFTASQPCACHAHESQWNTDISSNSSMNVGL